jgi:hypothetical protein
MVDVAGVTDRAEEPDYSIIVDNVYGDMASLRLYSNAWVDYLHIVKARGEWKLLHAAYDEKPDEPTPTLESAWEAIEKVALDYVEARYRGDAERHAMAYHYECVKRAFHSDGGLEVTSGKRMVDLCATGETVLPGAEWDIYIDDVVGDVAPVRINSTHWVDHLHIARARGRWGLLHVSYTRATG